MPHLPLSEPSSSKVMSALPLVSPLLTTSPGLLPGVNLSHAGDVDWPATQGATLKKKKKHVLSC